MLVDLYSLVESVIGSALLIWGLVILVNKDLLPSLFHAFVTDVENNKALNYMVTGMFLICGLVIIWVHNDWYYMTTSVIVTILGWILTIKSIVWLMFYKSLAPMLKKLSPLVLNFWFRMVCGGWFVILALLILISKYYG